MRWTAEWSHFEPETFSTNFLGLVGNQHFQNFKIWHYQNIARDSRTTDIEVAQAKRAIIKRNKARNDIIFSIDTHILTSLRDGGISIDPKAPLHSETPGMMIDRLSILALKIHFSRKSPHLLSGPFVARNPSDIQILLLEERDDLLGCFQTLMIDIHKGARRVKLYPKVAIFEKPTLRLAVPISIPPQSLEVTNEG